jgi:hypothetical protein
MRGRCARKTFGELEQNLKEAQAADQGLAELAERDAGLRAA